MSHKIYNFIRSRYKIHSPLHEPVDIKEEVRFVFKDGWKAKEESESYKRKEHSSVCFQFASGVGLNIPKQWKSGRKSEK